MSEYEVGYKKPPKHSQFKPNQSGNLKGRPKGQNSPVAIMNRMLNTPVKITEGGKTRTVSLEDSIVLRAMHNASKGDPKALATYMRYLPQLIAYREEINPPPTPVTVIQTVYVGSVDANDKAEMAAAVQNYHDRVKAGEDPKTAEGRAPVEFWLENPDKIEKLKIQPWEQEDWIRPSGTRQFHQKTQTPQKADPAPAPQTPSPKILNETAARPSAAANPPPPPASPSAEKNAVRKLSAQEYSTYFERLVDERTEAVLKKMDADGTSAFATMQSITMAILNLPPPPQEAIEVQGMGIISAAELTNRVESQITARVMERIRKRQFGG